MSHVSQGMPAVFYKDVLVEIFCRVCGWLDNTGGCCSGKDLAYIG